MRQAISKGRHAYVLVNIRSDGNAPFPVQAFSKVLPINGCFRSVNPISDLEDVEMMNWSWSDDLKGVTSVSGNQFPAGSTVIVIGQIIVVVVFQFQVQMPTRWIVPICPLFA